MKISYLLFITALFWGCEKTPEVANKTAEEDLLAQVALSQEYSEDIHTMVEEAYNFGKLITKNQENPSLSDAIVLKTDTSLSIDFGLVGILGKDGKMRKGKIRVRYPLGFYTQNVINEIILENFGINNTILSGKRTFKYVGLNAKGQKNWSVISDLTYILPNGIVLKLKATNYRTITVGEETLVWTDNQYETYSTTTKLMVNNNTYSIVYTSPLVLKVACRYFDSGILTLKYNDKEISIDYGYQEVSSCDFLAKLSFNNSFSIINLIL